MSKTRNKQHSEKEHLLGQIKSLKSENRQLRKRLKELEKQSRFYEEVVDEVIEDVDVQEACSHCGKGHLHEIDLKFLKLIKCNLCDYSEKKKIRG